MLQGLLKEHDRDARNLPRPNPEEPENRANGIAVKPDKLYWPCGSSAPMSKTTTTAEVSEKKKMRTNSTHSKAMVRDYQPSEKVGDAQTEGCSL